MPLLCFSSMTKTFSVQSQFAHISHTQKSSEFEHTILTQFLILLTTHHSATLLLDFQIETSYEIKEENISPFKTHSVA